MREPFSNREAIDLPRAARVVALDNLLRAERVVFLRLGRARYLARANPKISFHFSAAPPQTPPPQGEKNMARKFLVCAAASASKSSVRSLYFPYSAFSSFASARGAPVSEFSGNFIHAHTSQAPRTGRSHPFAMPARCLLRVRLVAPLEFVVFKVLFAAIREVFPDAQDKELEHIATGFLTLTTGKMSSRTGNVLTGESLLSDLRQEAAERAQETRAEDVSELADMIAVAALKYQILRQKVGSDITFDKQQAFSFEGDSGPYLQYTHARIASVLQKASEAGIEMSATNPPDKPYEIERLLYQFPEVLEHALVEKSPHHVLGFLTELTSSFNTFYAQEKIVDTTDEYAPYKLMIAKAVQQTLVNGLWVLGMKAPDRM